MGFNALPEAFSEPGFPVKGRLIEMLLIGGAGLQNFKTRIENWKLQQQKGSGLKSSSFGKFYPLEYCLIVGKVYPLEHC